MLKLMIREGVERGRCVRHSEVLVTTVPLGRGGLLYTKELSIELGDVPGEDLVASPFLFSECRRRLPPMCASRSCASKGGLIPLSTRVGITE